ncbi:MAG: T9SS type A sorting domain-containing protein [Bacteroidetes bacterium]|nr:T9SS type A sorting domain-containing protein [Bacteroidota bacterium]
MNQISSISALSVIVSPNPLTSEILHITIPGSADRIISIVIVSALGEIVYNGRLNSVGEKGKYALTLPDLKNGVYFLKADTGKESYTNRVVVLR